MKDTFFQLIQRLLHRLPGSATEAESPAASQETPSSSSRSRRWKRSSGYPNGDRAYFGEELWGASAQHRNAGTDETKLHRYNLPILKSETELAHLLGIPVGHLRWLTYDDPADTVWHYIRSVIPKRRGGERVILAPKQMLKAVQRTVLREILEKVPASSNAHGFVKSRSIVSNAQPHTGKAIVLNLDLKDFFPSITYPRVRGWFIAAGYAFPVASTLALLCTAHDRELFEHDGTRHYISVTPRTLVQGAPTSPALANLIAWRLDRRLDGLARKQGFVYTRYADDLTFSGDSLEAALHILRTAKHIIAEENFVLHPDKTRIFRRSSRQVVTGLVVNDQVNTPRAMRRRVRAILHNARSTGLEAQNRHNHPNFRAYLYGMIGLIGMSNPQQAEQLRAELRSHE